MTAISRRSLLAGAAGLASVATLASPAIAQGALDKIRVGVFPVTSALPHFVALSRGFYQEVGIEAETVRLAAGPQIVAAMITGDIQCAPNLVTIEGMNANTRRAGIANYIAIYAQNREFKMEQYVARNGFELADLAALRGRPGGPVKVMSAPGAANMAMARQVLIKLGLREGTDFTLTELAINLHADAMRAGTFDLGYTLEPTGTVIVNAQAGRLIEAGVISTYILGRPEAKAFAAGACLTDRFLTQQAPVAKRLAAAWRKAITTIRSDATTREQLRGNTFTPPDVVMTVPLPGFTMVNELTAQDRTDFQAFIDFATEARVLEQKVDTGRFLVSLDI